MHIHDSITTILAEQRAADLRRSGRRRRSPGFWADVAPVASIVLAFGALLGIAQPYV